MCCVCLKYIHVQVLSIPVIVSLWSRPFAGGGQVSNIVQRFNDAIEVPLTAYVKAMKMHMRRWDGRQVWGGEYLI